MNRFVKESNKKGYEGYFEKAYGLMGIWNNYHIEKKQKDIKDLCQNLKHWIK